MVAEGPGAAVLKGPSPRAMVIRSIGSILDGPGHLEGGSGRGLTEIEGCPGRMHEGRGTNAFGGREGIRGTAPGPIPGSGPGRLVGRRVIAWSRPESPNGLNPRAPPSGIASGLPSITTLR